MRVVTDRFGAVLMLKQLLVASVLMLAARASAGQGVGSSFPKIGLQNFAQTDATSLDDFYGRALLIEFFAYW